MKIKIIAVGTKMPNWLISAYQDYAKRLPNHLTLSLIEIPLAIRSKKNQDAAHFKEEEGQAILKKINSEDFVIALEVKGQLWNTIELAKQLQDWQTLGRNICLIIGGPDGLSESCLQRANVKWSLSPLTLPHHIVRLVIVEQLYRAWSVLQGHPYHRE